MRPSKPYTPIETQFLNPVREELRGAFTVVYKRPLSAKLSVRAPFALGLLIGFIMNRFVKDGVSFNKLTIDPADLSLTVQTQEYACHNKLDIKWV